MLLEWIMKKLFSSRNKRLVNKLWPLVNKVNEYAEQYRALSDEELKAKTTEFKERLKNGETTDDIMCEAYGVVKDACRRLKESPREEENTVEVTGHKLKWDPAKEEILDDKIATSFMDYEYRAPYKMLEF